MTTEFNFSIEALLVSTREPITVNREQRLRDAIQTMRDKEFSQLPVVDAVNRPVGLLTYESIARCLFNFDTQLDSLSVRDAMESRFKSFEVDDEALDILDELKREHCVLIVDNRKKLHRVLTLYDAAEYFRQRAQELVFLEEIEVNLRDWIAAAYQVPGDVDPAQIAGYANAYRRVSPKPSELQGPFHAALRGYIQDGSATVNYDGRRAQKLFDDHFAKPGKVKRIDQLTLLECIDLFLLPDVWEFYQGAVSMPDGVVRKFLDKVKEARNSLAHFRPITVEQRERIRFAWGWVREHRDAILASCPKPSAPVATTSGRDSEAKGAAAESSASVDPVKPDESRYAPLAQFLLGIEALVGSVALTFSEIENQIGVKLPQSAREHRSWWANDGHTHIQSRQWLNVGWRVTELNFPAETVVFQRNKEREQQYIRFFQQLMPALKRVGAFAATGTTTGRSYLLLKRLETHSVASVNFAFTRSGRSRIELYLDSPDQAENKARFDRLLTERGAIESELGASLAWERLDDHGPSRIAVLTDGFITDDEPTLKHLIQWATDVAPRFQHVFAKRLAT